MKKWNKKQNRRRYYLHSKVRERLNDCRVDARGQMIYVSYLGEKTGKYIACLQNEFDYGVQTEIR